MRNFLPKVLHNAESRAEIVPFTAHDLAQAPVQQEEAA